MDWKTLLLSPEGRIGRQEFWIGWIVLVGVGFILAFIPGVNMVSWILGIYVRVCLYSKRLHDMGKSGWWQIIPYVVGLLATIVAMVLFGSAIVAAAMSGDMDNPMAAMAMIGSLGGALLLWGFATLVSIAVLIWVGATPGVQGTNQYGSDPLGRSAVEVF